MLNLRLASTVSRIILPELTFTSKYALRVICQFMLNLRLAPAVSRITLPELTFTSKYALQVKYDPE